MNQKLVRFEVLLLFLLLILIEGKTQVIPQPALSKRTKENFDLNWQFHKGDIAMKHVVKAGCQGGLTDINVKVVTTEDTIIDYTDVKDSTVLYPSDWNEVNLPHDWCVEGTFVHDNSLGNQPAANGYLPTGIGFYRKEFEIPEADKGRKVSIEFDGIFRNSTVWVNGHLLCNHQSGYTPSNYDLTDVLRYGNEGRNAILVKVDAREYEGWWYEGWADIVKYPFLGGTFVWTGFDYRGEPTPYWWPCVSSHFGFMDICGFPKDGYYAYKAAWTDIPVVHIFPHWNWSGKEGDSIKVHCYTNCEEVELFLNSKSIGKKKAEPYTKLIWDLVYKPGKLEAKGYKGGKIVTRDIVETTTAPAQIAMNSDVQTLKADGCDVAIIRVAIKDAKGRVVPTANNLVKFSIEGSGRIIGTGNGNPTSCEPDKASQRMAFNGYCLVLVQTDKQTGEIRLKASSEMLKGNDVVIKVQ
jgi:hypothetical protein